MIAKGLRQESHAVDIAGDGGSGLDKALSHPYDLIVLDIRLPIKDGFAVCRELRQAGLQIPILMLTASGAYQDRVNGLDLGADDYLVMPFDLNELFARVRALLRRRPLLQDPIIRVDTLEINTRSRTVSRAGEFIRLTAKEYALLECLARDADMLLGRERISEQVSNESYDPFSNLIEEYTKGCGNKSISRDRSRGSTPGAAKVIFSPEANSRERHPRLPLSQGAESQFRTLSVLGAIQPA